MRVSIIICTMNRRKSLVKTLVSISKQTELPDEVIVIDSSNTKDNMKRLYGKTYFKFFVHFKCDHSLVKARRAGIKMASGDIVIFIDDDVILHKYWIQNAKHYFESRNDIDILSGRLQDNNKFIKDRITLKGMKDSTEPFTMRSVFGSNMAFRKEVLEKVSFNSNYKFYGQDDELSVRLAKAGYNIWLIPTLTCEHNYTRGKDSLDEIISTFMGKIYCVYHNPNLIEVVLLFYTLGKCFIKSCLSSKNRFKVAKAILMAMWRYSKIQRKEVRKWLHSR